MSHTLTVGPVTRIEGHLDVEVTIDLVNGRNQVIDAKCSGTMFRGFESIMNGRDPRDATHLTQRICGVCPTAHGMASSLALESAFKVTPPENGRILRNIILGSNFIQSHILHFYHLAAPDYINTTGVLDMSPWMPRFVTPDMVGGDIAQTLVAHYVKALEMRRKAHQMLAIFGGKMPCSPSMVVGGCTNGVTAAGISQTRALLTELQNFIETHLVPDTAAVAQVFPDYLTVGQGCGNLLAYGVFDLNSTGTTKLLGRGRYTDGALGTVSTSLIREYVSRSYYTAASGNLAPAAGVTVPQAGKAGAYSWIKAPRYDGKVHEVGPLARMWVNGDYRRGIGVAHRLLARALEAKKIAYAMGDWLNQLVAGQSSYTYFAQPATGVGEGLTEAPRGALGHWMAIAGSKISRYQFVSPTSWNCSPTDDMNQRGAVEQALIGTPVDDEAQPIEILRVIHSFDPCLSCSVHMVRPGRKAEKIEICKVQA